jgi:hypothetical protein
MGRIILVEVRSDTGNYLSTSTMLAMVPPYTKREEEREREREREREKALSVSYL